MLISRKGTASKWYHPFPKKNGERSKTRGGSPAHDIKPLGLEDSPTSDSLSAVGTSLLSASTPDSIASTGSGEKSKPVRVDRLANSEPQRKAAIGVDAEHSNFGYVAGGEDSEGLALGGNTESMSSGQRKEHLTPPSTDSWDVAAAESHGIMNLTRGMRVLCLDVFTSKIGGGEIRRWRPGEIAEMFARCSDELMVRVEFSSYGDKKDSICLCLQDEWTRLAPALLLTEEVMSEGGPLEGDALRESKRMFKPRSARRKSEQTGSDSTATAPKVKKNDIGERDSSEATKAGMRSMDGSVRRSESSHRGDQQVRGGSNRLSQSYGRSWRHTESGGGDVTTKRSGTQRVVKTSVVREAVRAALVAAKQSDSSASSGGSSSSIDCSSNSKSEGEKEKRGDQDEGEGGKVSKVGGKASVGSTLTSTPARRSMSLPEKGLTSPETPASRDVPGGSSGKRDKEERRGASASPPKSRKHDLPGDLDSDSGSALGSDISEGSGSGKGIADAGLEDSDRRKKRWTEWDMSSSKLPSIGDRFDCLDYFISSQTHTRVSRWRKAEVAQLKRSVKDRIGGRGYEEEIMVLVHYIRWDDKWDRWVSFTRNRERFAPYKTRSDPEDSTVLAAASPGATTVTKNLPDVKPRSDALGRKSKSIESNVICTPDMPSRPSSGLAATPYHQIGAYTPNGSYMGIHGGVYTGNHTGNYIVNTSGVYSGNQAVGYIANRAMGYTANQAVDYSANRAVSYTANQAVGYPRNQAVDYPGNQAVGYPGNQAVDYSANQAVSYTANQAVDYSANQAVSYTANQAVDYSANQAVSYTANQAVGYPRNQAVGYPGNQAVGVVGYGVYPSTPEKEALFVTSEWQLQQQQQRFQQSQSDRLANLSGRPLYNGVPDSGGVGYSNQSRDAGSSSGSSGGSNSSPSSSSSAVSSSRRSLRMTRGGRREKIGGGDGSMRSPANSSHDSEAALDAAFREAMRRNGLSVIDMEPDGNCLFRSISHQLYGDVELHHEVRKKCVDHMKKHGTRFGVFVAESFRKYLRRISQSGIWGDNLEIRAMEELFDRPIEIFSSEAEDLRPMKTDFDTASLDEEITPIKLSYHGQSHYNSVQDRSIRYPLRPRRSKTILRIREAQHASTPRSSSSAAASGGRAGGGRLGRGFGTEAASRRFLKGASPHPPELKETSTLPDESSSSTLRKSNFTAGSSSGSRGGANRGGIKVEGESKSSNRNFSGIALRLLGGNGAPP